MLLKMIISVQMDPWLTHFSTHAASFLLSATAEKSWYTLSPKIPATASKFYSTSDKWLKLTFLSGVQLRPQLCRNVLFRTERQSEFLRCNFGWITHQSGSFILTFAQMGTAWLSKTSYRWFSINFFNMFLQSGPVMSLYSHELPIWLHNASLQKDSRQQLFRNKLGFSMSEDKVLLIRLSTTHQHSVLGPVKKSDQLHKQGWTGTKCWWPTKILEMTYMHSQCHQTSNNKSVVLYEPSKRVQRKISVLLSYS